MAFRVLQIYMVLKPEVWHFYERAAFRVLQIYMVLKLQKLPLALVNTFGGLQIYMTLKQTYIKLHASYTKSPMGTAQWSEYQSRSFPS